MARESVPFKRADGVTQSERYLGNLCDGTFLSMWSYPGIYRDQRNGQQQRGDGKEICDLMVVFENHVLLFSDKDCAFPNTGSLDLDWSRWYRKAIRASADQLWGAERWIHAHPDRIFVDRTCTQPFPIALPEVDAMHVHRIIVAHNAGDRCRQHLGGHGSLMLDSTLEGMGTPFTVGHIDKSQGFVHVLDDISLGVVLRTLDTISDLVAYLGKKERFLLGAVSIHSAGEEELLSLYLRRTGADSQHDFVVDGRYAAVALQEGLWEEFCSNPQRQAQLEADKVSYSWDALIETFASHSYAHTQHFTTHPALRDQEKLLRFLARETRTRRRMLAGTLHEMLRTTAHTHRRTRVFLPSHTGDPHFVFLLLPEGAGGDYEEYRELRRNLLYAYCVITKLRYPDALDIVGVATETGTDEHRSEDLIYYDAREWDADTEAYALSLHNDIGLLKDVTEARFVEYEYPHVARGAGHPPAMRPATIARATRKVGRNDPCPCGSGNKHKRCCGTR